MTWNVLASRNNEAYGQVTGDSRSVQSFCIIKNTGHGNFVVGRFHTRARKWIIRLRLACVQSRPPHRHPFSDFFSEGRGRLYTGYLERIIHLQTVRQNWRINSGGLFIQNKNHYISETHYLSDANYQTDNPSHTNGLSTDVCGEATVSGVKTAISVVNEFAPQP